MKALVIAASKHGSTTEIAEVIVGALKERGVEATLRAPEQVDRLDDADAVVLGSAVYAGHWLKSATDLVERLAQTLVDRPVWLFSSGPIGDPPKPDEDPVDVAEVMTATKAQGHRVFPGKLERSRLGFAERAIVLALRAPEGDFRDWDAIRSWATQIAETLQARET
jgi:menaquinone-dependent protoporphyrinogen oxidase